MRAHRRPAGLEPSSWLVCLRPIADEVPSSLVNPRQRVPNPGPSDRRSEPLPTGGAYQRVLTPPASDGAYFPSSCMHGAVPVAVVGQKTLIGRIGVRAATRRDAGAPAATGVHKPV